MQRVTIREVGLRDGIQSLGRVIPTDVKKQWVRTMHAAGVREFEICSMLPPHSRIRQFSDAEDLIAYGKSLPGVTISALTPNRRGAERAIAAGVDKVIYILSISEAFNKANVNRTIAEAYDGFLSVAAMLATLPSSTRPVLSAGMSCAFGCAFEGRMPVARVVEWACKLAQGGAQEITLADTVGYGNPRGVKDVFGALVEALPQTPLAAHFHDTRGLGLANAAAAFAGGIRAFDASVAGLGGCPNAPGATGNVATEDLVFMLQEMGVETDIDLDALIAVSRDIASALPDALTHSHASGHGVPPAPKTGHAQKATS